MAELPPPSPTGQRHRRRMTQQAATPATQPANEPQRGKAGETVGADTAAIVDEAVRERGKLRPRLHIKAI